MTITKSRGATKKFGPISLGSKIVRFHLPTIDRRFTVHEDLICRTSTLFKTKLQKNRRTLLPTPDTEECCVCAEDLDPLHSDITFCATCCQSVHSTCIKQWRKRTTTCPMCRATWKVEQECKTVLLDSRLDAEAVQVYLDWLYTGAVRIAASLSRATDAFNVAVLKCWAVVDALQDTAFRDDVVRMWFGEAESQFWKESVEWAWGEGNAGAEIKGFVLEVFAAHMQEGWFRKESREWPGGFVREVGERMFAVVEGREKRVEWEEIREKCIGGKEVEQGNDGLKEKGFDGETRMIERQGKEKVFDERTHMVRRHDKEVNRRSREMSPLVGLPKVKSRRRTTDFDELPRVHVIQRRREKAKEKPWENSQGFTAQATRYLTGSR